MAAISTEYGNYLLGLFGFMPIPGIVKYTVSGQIQMKQCYKSLRQHRMIQCGKPGKCRESRGVALINEICHGVKKAPFGKGSSLRRWVRDCINGAQRPTLLNIGFSLTLGDTSLYQREAWLP